VLGPAELEDVGTEMAAWLRGLFGKVCRHFGSVEKSANPIASSFTPLKSRSVECGPLH
jgi:hypothetical protein